MSRHSGFRPVCLAGLNASQIDGDELAGFDKVGLTGGIKTTMEFESAMAGEHGISVF